MEWNDVYKVALCVITSAGGFGIICVTIIKFSVNIIATRLQSMYQLKIDKELENQKHKLDAKTYVSKVRFDKEFSIYSELSEKTIAAVFSAAAIIDFLNRQKDGPPQSLVVQANEAIRKYNEANIFNQRYAPFIDEDIYDCYCRLFSTFRVFLSLFEYRETMIADDAENIKVEIPYADKMTEKPDCDERIYSLYEVEKEIVKNIVSASQQSDEITKKVRLYLKNLDVL